MRKIRMGMVGGGIDSFIGSVHRSAAFIDGEIELVCGAFSSTKEKSIASGKKLYIPLERCYSNYQEMIDKEKKLPSNKKMDFVSIVTPNHMHFPVAKYALENGFDVVTDKPMCLNLKEAFELKKIVDKSEQFFAVTHAYSSYPLVKEARYLIENDAIGKIRKIVVEYPQGWLATQLESDNQKQASWRTDPNKSGISCCIGDIGTHCENLLEEMTGLQISKVFADLTTYLPNRQLDDDGNILIRLNNGAKGVLHASQISAGEENNLNIRIYGETGAFEWKQQEPNSLIRRYLDKPFEVLRAGSSYLNESTQHNSRLPNGHPEGLIEAFGNIYRNFAKCIQARLEDKSPSPLNTDFSDVNSGLRGMNFIEKVVESSQKEKWVSL